MEWVLRSPQIHSIFSNLGYLHADGYHVNENCNAALEAILLNILTEDKYLRSYRRSISFGENIKKDLIPLLIHAKEDKTIELLTRILVNLTIPIECLLSVDHIAQNDFGRHTIFEINNLLASTKVAFTDHRATRVVIDFLKKNVDLEQKAKLLPEQCSNVSNSLLLLRNILHIPEYKNVQPTPDFLPPPLLHNVQNQILWNIFSQSIDKVLIKLMSVPDACKWGVTLVQFIALLYKDQHVVTLQKLLNMWLETSLSESSEDNESNTPPDRGSDDSSPMLTSDPTSDSSDSKCNDESNSANNEWQAQTDNNAAQPENEKQICENENERESVEANNGTENNIQDSSKFNNVVNSENNGEDSTKFSNVVNSENNGEDSTKFDNVGVNSENNVEDSTKFDNVGLNSDYNVEDSAKFDNDTAVSCTSGVQSEQSDPVKKKNDKKTGISENSDCGYGTQMENQESISTSSNEDDIPFKKPVHQKPHNPKQRPNNKVRTGSILQERKRKKIVKRGKSNIINVHGLSHKTPTDDDISNILKEFTVDFLLKGYKSLVQILHKEILTNQCLEIDTSHFFWLVTYFLKFATQIELDLEHVNTVLSFDIASYLTAEGVNLCEQFELAVKVNENNLAPTIRRLHLVVTAIREFVQAIEVYKRISNASKPEASKEDQKTLMNLQIKMCDMEELRTLLVLLIRHYNPKYHSKQYLQDLIVTNHILLIFLDNVMKMPEYTGSASMVDHLKQFATPLVMNNYAALLEDYNSNGEFVNDCIFTVMHHVGGDLGELTVLLQPKILTIFTSMLKSEFEICDDWNDLVEYALNMYARKSNKTKSAPKFPFAADSCDEELLKLLGIAPPQSQELNEMEEKTRVVQNTENNTSKERWSEDEISSLSWMYLQCKASPDVIDETMKLLKEDGIIKSKESVIKELYKQNLINRDEYKKLNKGECDKGSKQANKKKRDDDISKLCVQLAKDGKSKFLDWVQKVLLETCHAKIYLDKRKINESKLENPDLLNFEVFKTKAEEMPVLSPVSYHSLSLNKSVPLVPWNCKQAEICKDLKFLQLLHKLGFHMPVDSGKVFIRIPNFWTADFLYHVAGKISPIDTSKLKFSVKDFAETSPTMPPKDNPVFSDLNNDTTMLSNYYQVHRQTHFATMVNFTPMPGCSYNSEANEVDNNNWLKVVQKSHEFKLTLKPDSPDWVCNGSEAASPNIPAECVGAPGAPPPGFGAYMGPLLPGGAPLLMPTVMTVKQEISTYSVQQVEEFCSNSVCETASVASDLTRMYVSDEDEKSDSSSIHAALDTETEFELDTEPELELEPELEIDPKLKIETDTEPELKIEPDNESELKIELDTEPGLEIEECCPDTLPRKRPRVTFAPTPPPF